MGVPGKLFIERILYNLNLIVTLNSKFLNSGQNQFYYLKNNFQ